MIKYIIQRLFYGFFVILGVVITVFVLSQALPGDPINNIVSPRASKKVRENMRKAYGLDQPIPVQLVYYLNDISAVSFHEDTPGNQAIYDYTPVISFGGNALVVKRPYLRRSLRGDNRRVDDVIFENLPGTAVLALAAMAFATFFGIGFGLIAALNHKSNLDNFLISLSVLGISAPSFLSAMIMSIIFGYYLADWTGLNLTGSLWENDVNGRMLHLENLILPALTLGFRPLAIIAQLTRSNMLEVMSQDYIRTAYAKGLGKYKIILKHALRNAVSPVLTAVSGWLATLMGGAFFVEKVFKYKGLGFATIKAVENNDTPMVMGATIFIAGVFVITNILMDILYSLIDPKVRLN